MAVLITGASQGIGKATALLLAEQGYDVVLAARQAERLEKVARAVRERGREALAVPTDVSDRASVEQLADKATTFGAIEVLVNNAGICMSAPMAETSIEDWQQLLDVNLWGYIYTVHAVLPQMLARGRGTIINVGSFGGKVPLPGMTAYCTSKYAVTGLTETLRLELSDRGIEVCGVHPGVTKSDFLERAIFRGQEAQGRERMRQVKESPFASQPEEVAKAIWQAIQHPQAEIVVGSASILTLAHRWFPGLTQWLPGR